MSAMSVLWAGLACALVAGAYSQSTVQECPQYMSLVNLPSGDMQCMCTIAGMQLSQTDQSCVSCNTSFYCQALSPPTPCPTGYVSYVGSSTVSECFVPAAESVFINVTIEGVDANLTAKDFLDRAPNGVLTYTER